MIIIVYRRWVFIFHSPIFCFFRYMYVSCSDCISIEMYQPGTCAQFFFNLVCRCFPTKQNATKKLFLYFGLFWPFLTKISQNWPKIKKIGSTQTVWWNFLEFGICWIEIWLKTAKIWHNWGPVWLCLFIAVWLFKFYFCFFFFPLSSSLFPTFFY